MKFEIDEQARQLIIGTMEQWLAGEPVWPLKRILETWGLSFENYRIAWSRGSFTSLDRDMMMFMLRDGWIQQFGFAIPCAELIELIRIRAPILDVGAGTGYITKLVRNAGVEVVGTDPFDDHYKFKTGAFDDRQRQLAAKTAIRSMWKQHPTVFCSWPTYSHTWFRQALKAMTVGQQLIVIREDATADDSAWDYLEACFGEQETIQIPCWPHMHDRCEVWVKKRNRFDHTALNSKTAVDRARRNTAMKKFRDG